MAFSFLRGPVPNFPFHGSATVKYHPLVNNAVPVQQSHAVHRLSDQLSDTTRLLDLLLSIAAEVSGANDDGDLGDTALAQDLRVAEGEEVDDGGGVSLLAAQVRFTLLGRDERPQLLDQSAKHSERIFHCPTVTPTVRREQAHPLGCAPARSFPPM